MGIQENMKNGEKERYIVGIDLGGMGAKGALFSFDGEIISEGKIKTNAQDGFEKTVQSLADLAKCLCNTLRKIIKIKKI